MNKLKTKLRNITKALQTYQFKKFAKHLVITCLVISFVSLIGYSTYKVLLIEYTIKESHKLYQIYSNYGKNIPTNNQNGLFAQQYFLKKLKKNNIILYNYLNPIISFYRSDKDIISVLEHKQGVVEYSYIKLSPSNIFYLSKYNRLAYQARLIMVYFQGVGETKSDLESFIRKTGGKTYISTFDGYFNFIIIPNFYSKQEIQNEIDNFIKEYIVKK